MARTRQLLACALVASLAAPSLSYATNGMFLIGYGAKSRAMGGVAIATPQDAIAGAVNPATIGFVKDRVDIGGDFFVPIAKARLGEGSDGLTYKSSANRFVMPAMGGAYKFNRKISIGFSAIPAGGGGSRYNMNLYNYSQDPNNPDVNDTLGVNLMIMQMNPTASYRVNKQNRIGASLVMSIQTFRAFGMNYFQPFTQSAQNLKPVENLTNRGNDWSYGAGVRLGWMGRFLEERLSLGATYTSRIYMTKFKKYTDLFAEQGRIDTPENFGVGFGFKVTPKLMIGADITRTLYSDVRSIGNTSAGFPDIFPDGPQNALGGDQGLGFGWDDQTVYKVGVAYEYSPKWTYRAGWNYGKSPIDEKNGEVLFNIVAPAVTQNHLTLGATYKPNEKMEWSFSYVHAFEYKQAGPTYIGAGNNGSIQMYQDSVGVNFGFKL